MSLSGKPHFFGDGQLALLTAGSSRAAEFPAAVKAEPPGGIPIGIGIIFASALMAAGWRLQCVTVSKAKAGVESSRSELPPS